MKRKGIILAGGHGTRLHPLTVATSKQMLAVYDKPMVYYPMSVLMLAGIRDILLISTPQSIESYRVLFEDGSKFGLNITYKIQEKPGGISQAFILGEKFLDGHPSALILGDNIFYGTGLSNILNEANADSNSTVFVNRVNNPSSYGILDFDKDWNPISIEEKPLSPKSNFAVTGLYFFDKNASNYAKTVKPSARGELEITSLIEHYMNHGLLNAKIMGRGYAWLDTGTQDHLLDAANFVRTLQNRQGLQIGCLEEIAYRKEWISLETLKNQAKHYQKTSYGAYLKTILEESL